MSELPLSSSLATVISLPDDVPGQVTKEWLTDAVHKFVSHDDLWSPPFMQGVVFNVPDSLEVAISSAAEAWLKDQEIVEDDTAC